MPSLKAIRKRITSVKSTQKITRAMKMVAGARLNRAQQRIFALRPYALKTQNVLASVIADQAGHEGDEANLSQPPHPLLVRRAEGRALYVMFTSDRGLCGSFNANVNKASERIWKDAKGEVEFYIVGRKGRDFMRRRNAPIGKVFPDVWDKLDFGQARAIADAALEPFRAGTVDAIYLVYNQFHSAMSQSVVVEPLLPVAPKVETDADSADRDGRHDELAPTEYLFEPDPRTLLDRLVPMYVEVSILRAMYESQASEFGARMTAMDSATKNAKDMIAALTMQYNRARQASITKELMEIIGGAEALKG